jgi:L-amino acid N-acyltransferase YncA
VEELIIDVFADDEKTIKLYKKFGFVEVGSYNSLCSYGDVVAKQIHP